MPYGRATRSLYQQLWGNQVPDTSLAVSNLNMLRLTFRVSQSSTLRAVRFYRDRSDNANHVVAIVQRGSPGNRSALVGTVFPRNPANVGIFGWNTKYLSSPLKLDPTQWYDYVLMYTGGVIWSLAGTLSSADLVSGVIIAPKDGSVDPFGVTVNNGADQVPAVNFNPNTSLSGALPGLDVIVDPTVG